MSDVSAGTEAGPKSRSAFSHHAPFAPGRRTIFVGAATLTAAAALPALAGARTSLKMAQTPSLNIGYEETGPASGDPVLLLHGWPYDPRSFDEVAGPLAEAGHRVIVPYSRCFGPTVYRSPEIFRSGQQAALGKDIIDLMDALDIPKATLAGFDWGNRAGCIAAALWPERVRALLSVQGYAIFDIPALSKHPGNAATLRQTWYRWFLNAPNGPAGLAAERDDIARQCWESWSPKWRFEESFFRETAKSFHNPDWVDTSIHCYRHWYGNAAGDPALQQFEERPNNFGPHADAGGGQRPALSVVVLARPGRALHQPLRTPCAEGRRARCAGGKAGGFRSGGEGRDARGRRPLMGTTPRLSKCRWPKASRST